MSLVNLLLSARGWRAAWAWALVLVMALRLGLGLLMGAAWVAVKPSLPANLLSDPHLYGNVPVPTTFPWDAVLSVWVRWDAVHFLNLALYGYFDVRESETTFFILYPLLTRFVTQVTRGDVIVVGLLVSTIATIVAFASLYVLVEEQYGFPSAQGSVVVLAVYPTAFFLIAPFSEALFLAFTLSAFVSAYKRRWGLAGVLGALASLTRSQGMFTAGAFAWIAWEQWRHSLRLATPLARVRWAVSTAVGLALPLLGGLAFFWWRQAAGFAPYSELWGHYGGSRIVNPAWNLLYAVAQFIIVHDLPTGLDVSSVCVFLALTLVMLASRRWRRVDWLIYMSTNLILFLSKHNDLASALQSTARYVLALFPGFIVIGDWLAHRGSKVRFTYMVLSSTLLMVLSALYVFWWFIG